MPAPDPPFPVEVRDDTEAILRSSFYWSRSLTGPDPRLHFRIALPHPYDSRPEPAPGGVAGGPFQPLARFVDREHPDVEVTVSLALLPREVGPADWVDLSLDRDEVEVLRRDEVYGPGGAVADVLARGTRAGIPYIRRTTARKDGRRLFRIDARSSEDHYPSRAEDFLTSLSSFHLLRPEGLTTAEPLRACESPSPLPVRFEHPESWTVSGDAAGDERWVAVLGNEAAGSCAGRLTVEVVRAGVDRTAAHRTAFSSVSDHAERLRRAGVRLNGAPLIPVPATSHFEMAWLYNPRAMYEGHEIDAPVLLLERPDAWASIGLIAPARKAFPEWWAVNKRAFEIVRDSLTVGRA